MQDVNVYVCKYECCETCFITFIVFQHLWLMLRRCIKARHVLHFGVLLHNHKKALIHSFKNQGVVRIKKKTQQQTNKHYEPD